MIISIELSPLLYRILEVRVVDVDDYPEFKKLLFSTLQYGRGEVIVDCKEVPKAVFNLPVVKRLEKVKTLITILFVFDEPAYICRRGVVGRAFEDGALSAINRFTLEVEGPTLTLYHETAHVLGLRHPHDSDPIPWGEDWTNWFYDWSATPMSYDSACTLRTMMEELYFTKIDKDSMDMGLTLYLMKKTRKTVYDVLEILKNSEIGLERLPRSIFDWLSEIKHDLNRAIEEFRKYNYFNWDEFYGIGIQKFSAFDYAISAYEKSTVFSQSVEKFIEVLIEMRESSMRLDQAMKELERLKVLNHQLTLELENIKKSYEKLREDYRKLDENYQNAKNQYSELSNKYVELEKQLLILKDEKTSLEAEVSRLRSEVEFLSILNIILIAIPVIIIAVTVARRILSSKRRIAPPPPPPHLT